MESRHVSLCSLRYVFLWFKSSLLTCFILKYFLVSVTLLPAVVCCPPLSLLISFTSPSSAVSLKCVQFVLSVSCFSLFLVFISSDFGLIFLYLIYLDLLLGLDSGLLSDGFVCLLCIDFCQPHNPVSLLYLSVLIKSMNCSIFDLGVCIESYSFVLLLLCMQKHNSTTLKSRQLCCSDCISRSCCFFLPFYMSDCNHCF